MALRRLAIGFLPLNDAAPLVLAKEEGLFEEFGLDVALSREHSWARIRDKLAIGDLDAAHMLSPMVLASALGLGPAQEPFATAFGLNLNGNGVTVSNALYKEMQEIDPWAFDARPVTADALRVVAARRLERGDGPITFAMVYPYSTHNYLLRHWLSASGLHPDRNVRIIVVPPPDMVRLCQSESIDGYCVGEPWNTLAAHEGVGHQIVAGSEIWPAAPEKVLAVRRNWIADNAETHLRLIRALMRAVIRLQTDDGKEAAVSYLSRRGYIGLNARHIARALGPGGHKGLSSLFDPSVAGFPWRSKAAWLAVQMVRWGQINRPIDISGGIAAAFRTDLFREAAAAEGVRFPLVDGVVEGAHDETWPLDDASAPIAMPPDRLMMDKSLFDPADPIRYLEQFVHHNIRRPLEELLPGAL